jgi:diaminopimelate decarboxylase
VLNGDIAGQVHGDAFYVLDTGQFVANYHELLNALRALSPNTFLSYSYKTNYLPRLGRLIDEAGGYAEVVSDMEYRLAIAVGVPPARIIFNGPYKTKAVMEELLLGGGQVNIDAAYELDIVLRLAAKHPGASLGVALRCNFDIGDGVLSRFGFDTTSADFVDALAVIRQTPNLVLFGLHAHFATRQLETFRRRSEGMIRLIRTHFQTPPSYICLGGGLFGKMEDSLAAQFDVPVPDYRQYAEVLAGVFAEAYGALPSAAQPALFLEPGSALVGDSMLFVAKVLNIKSVRGKWIATLTGSQYNINPTLNKKNPPIWVIPGCEREGTEGAKGCEGLASKRPVLADVDFAGYTCIESDYLYRHYEGELAVGDYVVFGNVGSYSIVLKPPFILPNVPVVEVNQGEVTLLKRQETFEDVFCGYRMF